MSILDLKVLQPTWAEALTRVAALQEKAPSVFTKEYQPGINVADLTDQQYKWLFRSGTFSVGDSTPINAARVSVVMFSIPSVSAAKIIRFKRIVLNTAVAMNVGVQVIALGSILPALQNTVTRVPGVRDSRMVGAQTSLVSPQFATSIAGITTSSLVLPVSAVPLVIDDIEMTICKDGALFFAGATINQGFNLTATWEERDAVSSELG